MKTQRGLIFLVLTFLAYALSASAEVVTASYNSATDVPVTAANYTATGNSVDFTLGYASVTGAELMVVKNTNLDFISGVFSNLTHGQTVTLSYGGVDYNFVVNYYGGTGNDLVLMWKNSRLLAWGYNFKGQLGNTRTMNSNVPVAVPATDALAGRSVVAVSAGSFHSLALCSDGTVAAWGNNGYGQLGNNSTTQSNAPVAVTATGVLSGKTVVAVAAGDYHSVALCSDGTVAAWGSNDRGQLGNNSTTRSNVPVVVVTSGVLSGKTVVAVAAGDYHSVALCSDGTVAAWGSNGSGQLGNNITTSSNVPVAVTATGVLSGKTVVAVSAGSYHSVALCSDGTMAAWGSNGSGQLGNNSAIWASNVPVKVTTNGVLEGKKVSAISTGASHSLALCSDGTLAAWGWNVTGQLGNNNTTDSSVPVAVTATGVLAGKTVIAVSAGVYHSVALCSDGTLTAWGNNGSGQLGNNNTTQSNVPVAVAATSVLLGKKVVTVTTGWSHSMALCEDGTLAAWGSNFNGQLGNNSNSYSTIPELGVLADKTMVAVSAGYSHSIVLCSNGTLASWGDNNYGQLGNNSTTASYIPIAVTATGVLTGKTVVAVSAGGNHSVALCSDGTLAAWGWNSSGQLGNNSTTDSTVPVAVMATGVLAGKTVVAVSAGYSHSVALCSDGTLAAWGNNGDGQLGNNSTTQSAVPVAVTATG